MDIQDLNWDLLYQRQKRIKNPPVEQLISEQEDELEKTEDVTKDILNKENKVEITKDILNKEDETRKVKKIKDTTIDLEDGTSIHKRKDKESKRGKFKWISLEKEYLKLLIHPNFMIKDVLGDGNCQFRAIEEALKETANMGFTHKQLRAIIAERITALSDDEFKRILENYRLEKTNGEFVGGWDPFSVTKRNQLSNQIKKPGFHFQGDFTTLALLSKILNIEFIILQSNLSFYFINSEKNSKERSLKIILLYYDIEDKHYKAIGLKENDKIRCIFYSHDNEIKRLRDKNEFYKSQIESIKNEKQKLTLNEMYAQLENRISNKLSRNEKLLISKLKLI